MSESNSQKTAGTSPKEIALGFFDDLGAGRFKEALDRFVPNSPFLMPIPAPYNVVKTVEQWFQHVENNIVPHFAGPIVWEITDVVAEGERVVVEAQTKTKSKQGPIYHNYFSFFFVVRNGKIVEGREHIDTATVIYKLIAGKL